MWLKPLGVAPSQAPRARWGCNESLGLLLEFNSQGRLVSELLFGGDIRRVPEPRVFQEPPLVLQLPRGRHLWSPLGGGDVCGEWTLGVLGAGGSKLVSPLRGGLSRRARPWAGGEGAAEPCLPPGLRGRAQEPVAEVGQDERQMEGSRADGG